jgi:mRNA-degrading endonuclease toxin of MazEF toxin-antitoxin module
MQVAVITGSNGLIGQATCRKLMQSGFLAVGIDIGAESKGNWPYYACDLTDLDRMDENHGFRHAPGISAFATEGPPAPRAAARPGFAPDPDLGSGRAVAQLPFGGPSAIVRHSGKLPCTRRSGVYRLGFGVGRRVRRGEIWTIAGGKDYAGKPPPVVVVHDDSFDATDSITVCAFTTNETEAPLFRLPVEPRPPSDTRLMRTRPLTIMTMPVPGSPRMGAMVCVPSARIPWTGVVAENQGSVTGAIAL